MTDSGSPALGGGIAARAVRYAKAVGATTRNAAEVVRFGGLETGEVGSPYTVATEQLTFRLRHYFSDETPADATPLLLVPPLMLTADVWDVSPNSSAVATLHDEGLDVWVVDFGDPGHEPGGLERTLTDHVLAVSLAVDQVNEATGRDVILTGYSQGGMFCYQTAAYRRGEGIDSLVTFGSPVDARAPLPVPVSPETAARLADWLLESGLLRHLALPSWASRTGFKLLAPAKTVQSQLKFMLALHDRESLLPRERQRRFLEAEGFTAWSGPAIAELLELFVTHNRMLAGGFAIKDRLVTLADIKVPILIGVGSTDTIGHPDSVRAIDRAAPGADVYEMTLRAGHFGLVVGSTADSRSWPGVAAWARWRAGGELPADIVPADEVEHKPMSSTGAGATTLIQAAEFGLGAGLMAWGGAKQTFGLARGLISEAPAQLPRLARIGQLHPDSRMSLGLLLDEQARRDRQSISFLFGDRAYRHHDVKTRVDNVVKGLISVGIHHGDRVGVLMDTRPSAFTVVAALSRLGATAVLLRPDGDLKREADLGQISWVVSDPEHLDGVAQVSGVTWCVLGGGGEHRELDNRIVDMERIDPDKVELPAWFSANPHVAGDLAFVLFTGAGEQLRPIEITNWRWALSALGTASAAALRPGDTVYSTTPLHHSSALLMSIGGAIAGGARFAMSTADDPDCFWEEVRRYGASHVSYTWTSLRSVVEAAPHTSEQHHPIRMFMGSGMPRNLWRKVDERFPSSRVLEFYASVGEDSILANVQGVPIGSMGRPVPGTAEVRIAAFDLSTCRLERDANGMGRRCGFDEVGLLLARAKPGTSHAQLPLRGVFDADDRWLSTGDLFSRDEQGNYWLVDSVSSLIVTVVGVVAPSAVRNTISTIPAVDLCVVFGVPDGDNAETVVAAFTSRAGRSVDASDLDHVFDRTPVAERPTYIQQVRQIPVTTWHRPIASKLLHAGIPKPTKQRRVWKLDAGTGNFAEL